MSNKMTSNTLTIGNAAEMLMLKIKAGIYSDCIYTQFGTVVYDVNRNETAVFNKKDSPLENRAVRSWYRHGFNYFVNICINEVRSGKNTFELVCNALMIECFLRKVLKPSVSLNLKVTADIKSMALNLAMEYHYMHRDELIHDILNFYVPRIHPLTSRRTRNVLYNHYKRAFEDILEGPKKVISLVNEKYNIYIFRICRCASTPSYMDYLISAAVGIAEKYGKDCSSALMNLPKEGLKKNKNDVQIIKMILSYKEKEESDFSVITDEKYLLTKLDK